mmetsp:Transcript_11569/g.25369  ORF Transcript_11569/g.25369 Transcript_11569/m.25369 type:complete len:296 (+) Transcript_11569:162-1049(+)
MPTQTRVRVLMGIDGTVYRAAKAPAPSTKKSAGTASAASKPNPNTARQSPSPSPPPPADITPPSRPALSSPDKNPASPPAVPEEATYAVAETSEIDQNQAAAAANGTETATKLDANLRSRYTVPHQFGRGSPIPDPGRHQHDAWKLCNGMCGIAKIRDEYTVSQWKKPLTKQRFCFMCSRLIVTPTPPPAVSEAQLKMWHVVLQRRNSQIQQLSHQHLLSFANDLISYLWNTRYETNEYSSKNGLKGASKKNRRDEGKTDLATGHYSAFLLTTCPRLTLQNMRLDCTCWHYVIDP